jgi:thiol-disulfide isomerase/thioredoxin
MVFFESTTRTMRQKISMPTVFMLFYFMVLSSVIAHAEQPLTVNAKYPSLDLGILGSAKLAALDKGTLATADGFTITKAELTETVSRQDPKLRGQFEKNLLFILEQEITRRALINEAVKAGVFDRNNDENQIIQELFEQKAADASVSEEDLKAFYLANREMVGGAPFEQVKEGIRQYLLQDKKQQAVAAYLSALTDSIPLRVNKDWVELQSRVALDNPVDKARLSGKPTMVEFGAAGCIPCDMMQPILDKLRKDYPQKLNVVFIHVGEEQILAARYGIRSIPVQVFYDARGKEVFRHVGFYAEKDVLEQLKKAGL